MVRKGRDRRYTKVSKQIAVRLSLRVLADVHKYGAGMGLSEAPAVRFFLELGLRTWLADKVGDGLELGKSGLDDEIEKALRG